MDALRCPVIPWQPPFSPNIQRGIWLVLRSLPAAILGVWFCFSFPRQSIVGWCVTLPWYLALSPDCFSGVVCVFYSFQPPLPSQGYSGGVIWRLFENSGFWTSIGWLLSTLYWACTCTCTVCGPICTAQWVPHCWSLHKSACSLKITFTPVHVIHKC